MDEIQKAVKSCFNKYVEFKGRADRPEFWWFFLFQVVVLAILGMVSNVLYGLATLALLLPGLAVGARRLHDIGKSGWFLLIGLIPFIGWLVLIYFFAQPSGPANEYGGVAAAPDAPTMAPGQQ
ncbi:MAG: DUF805 domain-containing protein [Pseudomonadota bacterium]